MKWNYPYYQQSGKWTITRAGNKEGLPKPYGLFYAGKLVKHFATEQEAKQHAEMLESTQA